MDWKQEAAEKLKNYGARKRALTTIPQQIKEAQLRRTGIRSARVDGTAVRGGGSGREDMLLGSLVYQEELERRLAVTKTWVAAVEEALCALTEEERLILDRFYIHPTKGSVGRLCDELCIERASAYRKKEQALRRFTMAMYGWEEV